MKHIIGTKYQTYINDELVILRLARIKSEFSYILVDENGTKISMNKEEMSKLIILESDALLNIFISETKDNVKDVFACVQLPYKDTPYPSLIIRQDVISNTKNMINDMKSIWVGEAFFKPTKDEINDIFDFVSINHTLSVAIYVDDSLDNIIKIIGKMSKEFDNTLVEIKSKTKDNPNIFGYCDTLEQLLKENHFIEYYRNLFNITPVDFPIELDNNVTEDGVVTLNSKQISKIEDLLRQYITEVSVLKYDKDIDVGNIVSKSHVMISDSTDTIYLISYITKGYYPVDEDIANAMRSNLLS